jgi:RNA-directed DNA polymerase
MLVNLDVKDFFPSTTATRVKEALIEHGMNEGVARLISEICTYDNSLPQGAPTSTALANLAFLGIDKRFNKLCKRHRLTYSRYVDDISISGERELITLKGEFLKIVEQGGYRLAEHKIVFAGRNKPQIVNGILVNDKLRPTRQFISDLKSEIRMCWPENLGVLVIADLNGLTKKQLQKNLWGRVNFIRQFDKKKTREVRALMVKIDWS